MMYVNDKDELVIEPSFTVSGCPPVVVANKENVTDVAYGITLNWLWSRLNRFCIVNGITWYLDESNNIKTLSYSTSYSTTKVELYKHESKLGIIACLYNQFQLLKPDLVRRIQLSN